jgi:hypothetical protein
MNIRFLIFSLMFVQVPHVDEVNTPETSYCYYVDVGGQYEKLCVKEQTICNCYHCICNRNGCWRGCGGVSSGQGLIHQEIDDQPELDKWIIEDSLTHTEICMQEFNSLLSISVPITYWGLSCTILREARGYVSWTALMMNSRLLAMDMEQLIDTDSPWHCFANIVPREGSWYLVRGMYKVN